MIIHMKTYTPENWHDLAKSLYDLIVAEINNASPDTLPEIYPKIVIMYEFFRLIRGEAFHSLRPAGASEFQKEIYKMENDLAEYLKQLEKQMNFGDDKTLHHLELMKKSFCSKYFNR